MDKTKSSILIIRMSALGDVAMTIPVIYSFAWQYPHINIYVLTRKAFEVLFINKPMNISVIGADFKKQHHGLMGLVRLIFQLEKYKFNEIADFHNVLRSWVIDAYMIMRRRKVVIVDKKRRMRHAVVGHSHEKQTCFIDRYVDVLKRLGYEFRLTFKSILPDATTDCRIPIAGSPIGIAPFARYYNKIYPLQLMEKVIALLCQKGYNVYLFGARGKEAEQLGQFAERYKNCISLAGQYTLEEELSIMHNMLVMVSMDSANQHLASLAGVKVITIWGSTSPSCGFTPYMQESNYSICKEINCQPCSIAGGKSCPKGHFLCMNSIRPEEVVGRIEEIIL